MLTEEGEVLGEKINRLNVNLSTTNPIVLAWYLTRACSVTDLQTMTWFIALPVCNSL